MSVLFSSEPPLTPPEDTVLAYCDNCKCELYDGETVYRWDSSEICEDCMKEKISEMDTDEIAYLLGCTNRRLEGA